MAVDNRDARIWLEATVALLSGLAAAGAFVANDRLFHALPSMIEAPSDYRPQAPASSGQQTRPVRRYA